MVRRQPNTGPILVQITNVVIIDAVITDLVITNVVTTDVVITDVVTTDVVITDVVITGQTLVKYQECAGRTGTAVPADRRGSC